MYDFKVLFEYCVYMCVYNNNENICLRNSVVPLEALRVATFFFVRSTVAKNSYHNYLKL